MKKILLALFLVFILAALSVSTVLAQTDKINLEGEIITVDEFTPTITVRTSEGDEFVVHFPPDYTFTFTDKDISALVHVKGTLQEDGTILAIWVKFVEGEDDGGKSDSAYCSGEKETPHPVSIVLANQFDKDIEEIMGYFCDGFGFGQIYLALKTEQISGVDYATLLLARSEGQGWGQIWKDLGYHGKPKDKDKDKTPPGQEKDKDKTPPGQDKDKDKNKDKTPPGQEKDKDKIPPGQDKNKGKKPQKNKGK